MSYAGRRAQLLLFVSTRAFVRVSSKSDAMAFSPHLRPWQGLDAFLKDVSRFLAKNHSCRGGKMRGPGQTRRGGGSIKGKTVLGLGSRSVSWAPDPTQA